MSNRRSVTNQSQQGFGDLVIQKVRNVNLDTHGTSVCPSNVQTRDESVPDHHQVFKGEVTRSLSC